MLYCCCWSLHISTYVQTDIQNSAFVNYAVVHELLFFQQSLHDRQVSLYDSIDLFYSGCPESYNISLYSQYRDVNSQVAEQRNAMLVKLQSMVSYMNLQNFKRHVTLFIYFHNMMAMARNQFRANFQYSDFFKSLYRATQRLK